MQTLHGKTALITGAGKGLGRAMALALANEGVNLLLISRTLSDIEKVAAEVQALPPDVLVQIAAADISKLEEVRNALTTLTAENKKIDILINNAGILSYGSVLDIAIEEWERVIQTNVLGTYYMIHEVLPFLLEQQQGDIINIASTAGLKGAADLSAYGASKAAVINLSEAIMQEVRKKGIRVTIVNPSTIATDMTLSNNFTDGNPERVLQPEDLAFLVVNNLKLPQRAFVKEVSLWSTNP
ncbi:3-ketoacyl-ACP reductase [Sphingobacterium psychroaquaticum]|uniref:3-oxoacyl-[acyl-carrier protein] reductase n=1 Tax=Sphingobacterium psychroaquaticum TaxID=561061 RepID=A0A1X7JJF7_9SPHI|nr:3-ketoacyl-ACP reductase [Sphingobacterium psychroaquaticum]SMG27994.1 3-oxoacyl-[acyl-carrier protein] reductase [Sphingobacterium psychroaquaticum]